MEEIKKRGRPKKSDLKENVPEGTEQKSSAVSKQILGPLLSASEVKSSPDTIKLENDNKKPLSEERAVNVTQGNVQHSFSMIQDDTDPLLVKLVWTARDSKNNILFQKIGAGDARYIALARMLRYEANLMAGIDIINFY